MYSGPRGSLVVGKKDPQKVIRSAGVSHHSQPYEDSRYQCIITSRPSGISLFTQKQALSSVYNLVICIAVAQSLCTALPTTLKGAFSNQTSNCLISMRSAQPLDVGLARSFSTFTPHARCL